MASTGQPPAIVVGRFELARGAWFDRHRHDVHQLAWAATGVLSVRTRGRAWVLPPGLALWIPAGLAHETGAATAVDMRGIYLPPGRVPVEWSVPTVVAIDTLCRALLDHLMRDDIDDDQRAHAEALLVATLSPVPDIDLAVPMPQDARAAGVAASLAADPADPRPLAAWGRQAGASPRTLARIWAAETGMGFAQWRARLRLQAALPMLAAGAAVNVVARRVGYQTPSAFVAAFRREVGVPPAGYFAGRTG